MLVENKAFVKGNTATLVYPPRSAGTEANDCSNDNIKIVRCNRTSFEHVSLSGIAAAFFCRYRRMIVHLQEFCINYDLNFARSSQEHH